jgi:hypothetical protein
MARYAADFQRTGSTSASTGSIVADATRPRRFKIYDLIFGSEAAAADNPFLWRVARITAAGTSTGVTPQPLDPADAATESDAGENHTVEPTYTAGANLIHCPLNQRATFRWVAAPGGELVAPATASNGFGIISPVGSAVIVTVQAHYEEQ